MKCVLGTAVEERLILRAKEIIPRLSDWYERKWLNKTLPFNRETKSLSLFPPAFMLDLLKVKLIFWCRIKCLLGTVINTRLTLKEKYFTKIKTLYMILFSLNKSKQSCVVYTWYYSLGISTGSTVRRLCWLQRLQQLFMTSDLILGNLRSEDGDGSENVAFFQSS